MMNHKIKISQELDEEYMSAVDKLREKAFQDMTEKCKIRQKKKFELILSRSSTRSAQKQDRYKEKWIVNNSSRVLSEREKEVLSKGLNFSPAPTRIPIPEIVVAVEEGLRKVISTVDNDKNVARKTIIGVLSKTKIPATNITQEERKALKELKKDESIIILPADKGKATVILDRKEYDEKISAMLSDTNTYKELKRDPAPALESKMNDMLISFKKSGSLPLAMHRKLRSSAGKTPSFYGLPKIHKTGIPLRPIVSFIGSPTYNLSNYLVTVLSPMVGKSSSFVKNSKEFAGFISSQTIETGRVLVSFDVTSLFTSIPIERAIEIASKRLKEDDTLEERTCLTADEIIKLLEFCLSAAFLSCKGKYYKQTYGTAMGSPVSVIVANLVMEEIEERAISEYPITLNFWKRYVDDIITALPKKINSILFGAFKFY